MARLTIEECWWTDPRRETLGQLLKNPLGAEGVALRAWRLAQEHWVEDELIPGYKFVLLVGCWEFLKSNLAIIHKDRLPASDIIRTPVEHILTNTEQVPTNVRTHMNIIEDAWIYVRGSEKYLSWGREIRQKRVEAGKKSAEKRRLLYGSAQPISNTCSNTSEQTSTPSEQNPTNSNIPVPVSVPSSVPVSVSEPVNTKNTNMGIRLNYSSEFETVWKQYGTKGDKKASYAEFQKLKLTPEDMSNLGIAIANHHKEKTDPKFRKDFERFLKTDWREWLSPRMQLNGVHPKTQQRLDTYEQWKQMHEQREGENDEQPN